MTYDAWIAHNPQDEWLGPEPEEEIEPEPVEEEKKESTTAS
jgi:hypothetical protein